MPNGMYGGVRGKETKIGRKTISFPYLLDRDYFIHFSNFIEILLAYLKNLRIFVSEFGARILDSRG